MDTNPHEFVSIRGSRRVSFFARNGRPKWHGICLLARPVNICSLIVHTRPDRVRVVEQGLLDLPGVEIHGGRAEGKLIVTVEDVGQGKVADTLTSINRVEGVINTVLIYHYDEGHLEK